MMTYYASLKDCCVSIVDMIRSTRITANIRASHKIGKYYSIFINNMAAIGKYLER